MSFSSLDILQHSYSGADCRAYAWFPQKNHKKTRGDIKGIEAKIKQLNNRIKEIQKEKELATRVIDTAIKNGEPLAVNIADTIGDTNALPSGGSQKITTDMIANNPDGVRAMYMNSIQRYDREIQNINQMIDSHNELLSYYAKTIFTDLIGLQTISVSVHEPKGMVRRLGHSSVCGFTRSVRTIAGSMIFTIINTNPFESLMFADPHMSNSSSGPDFPYTQDSHIGWGTEPSTGGVSGQAFYRPVGRISPFNIMLQYISEYGDKNFIAGRGADFSNLGAGMILEEVELIGQGIVTSVHDMVTEVTYNFVAKEYKQFHARDSASSSIPERIRSLKSELTGPNGFLGSTQEEALESYITATQEKILEREQEQARAEAEAAAKLAKKEAEAKAIAKPTAGLRADANPEVKRERKGIEEKLPATPAVTDSSGSNGND
tara:strand:- start:295 stop:1593 length:1299 start_codon:yes stop_codon:yes gene_type:complete